MRKSQESMSSVASDYNVARLIGGTVFAFLVCVLSFLALSGVRPFNPEGVFTSLIYLLYAVLMFASSYVEEEHNFWYWITSGWFMLLFLRNMRGSWFDHWIFHPAIMSLIIHRFVRRWNQTGQKYAGADDIVNSGIFQGSNSFLLWALIGATYMDITIRLAKHVARSIATFDTEQKLQSVQGDVLNQNLMVSIFAVLPLCGTAFVFKLAFTAKDAPESTQGISDSMVDWIESANLVGLARMVFGGLVLSGLWIAGAEWQRSTKRSKTRTQGNGGRFHWLLTRHGDDTHNRLQILPLLCST